MEYFDSKPSMCLVGLVCSDDATRQEIMNSIFTEQFHFHPLLFRGELIQLLELSDSYSPDQYVSGRLDDHQKEHLYDLMDVGRVENGDSHWCRLLEARLMLLENQGVKRVVVPDVSLANQVERIRSLGGYVLKISSPQTTQSGSLRNHRRFRNQTLQSIHYVDHVIVNRTRSTSSEETDSSKRNRSIQKIIQQWIRNYPNDHPESVIQEQSQKQEDLSSRYRYIDHMVELVS